MKVSRPPPKEILMPNNIMLSNKIRQRFLFFIYSTINVDLESSFSFLLPTKLFQLKLEMWSYNTQGYMPPFFYVPFPPSVSIQPGLPPYFSVEKNAKANHGIMFTIHLFEIK